MTDEYYLPLQSSLLTSDIDCYQHSLSDVGAGYWAYIGSNIALTVILMGLWFIYREYFPIKERSPYLVMTSLFGNMLVQISFPASFINEMDGDVSKPVRDILWGFLLFGGILLFLPYIWRAVRLQYAFDWKIESKSLEFLYSRQSLMCLITIVAALFYSSVLLAFLQENALVYYSVDKAGVAHFSVFTLMYFLEMLFMITTCYRLRFVKSEFNFQREIVLVIIIIFVSFNVNVFFYDQIQGCHSQIAFSSSMILVNVRNWIIVGITAVYPLFIATKCHCFLSQGVVVNLFQYVIGDDTCMQAFEEYIWTGRERVGTLLHSSAYEPNDEIELFRVFLSLRRRIMDDTSSPRIIKRMMEDYVENQRVADLFPPIFIYELKVKYRESREGGEPMTVKEFKKLEGFCILYFLDVFDRRYKLTKSFYYIKDLFQKNEVINKKMQALNMFAIS